MTKICIIVKCYCKEYAALPWLTIVLMFTVCYVVDINTNNAFEVSADINMCQWMYPFSWATSFILLQEGHPFLCFY